MRKVAELDVTMFDNLLTMLNRKAIFRELSTDECSAIHQARMWAKNFREELFQESQVNAAMASAKCIDPGPPFTAEQPSKKKAKK